VLALAHGDVAQRARREQLLELDAAIGKPVLVDPKGKDYRKYAGATMVTPNQREAEEACDLPLCDDTVDAAGARVAA